MHLKVDVKNLIPLWTTRNGNYMTEEENEAIKKLADYIGRLEEFALCEDSGRTIVSLKKDGKYLCIDIDEKNIKESM